MMLTFVLNRLACCKLGFVAFWDFSCLEDRIFFTTSGPKRTTSDDPADNSFALYLLTDKVTSDLVIC